MQRQIGEAETVGAPMEAGKATTRTPSPASMRVELESRIASASMPLPTLSPCIETILTSGKAPEPMEVARVATTVARRRRTVGPPWEESRP